MSEIRVLAFVDERLAPSATETTGVRTRMILGATPFCSIPADVQQRQQKSFTPVYKITLFNFDAALIRSNFTSFLLIFSLTSLAIILIRGSLLSRLTLGTRGLFLACGWMLRCRPQVDTERQRHERQRKPRMKSSLAPIPTFLFMKLALKGSHVNKLPLTTILSRNKRHRLSDS